MKKLVNNFYVFIFSIRIKSLVFIIRCLFSVVTKLSISSQFLVVLREPQAAPVRCNDEFYYLIENQISEDDNLKSKGNVPDT